MSGFTSPLRLSLPPTSSSSAPTLLLAACSVVRSASAVLVPASLVRVATGAVRRRKVVPLASSLPASVVDSVVAVVPLLLKKCHSPLAFSEGFLKKRMSFMWLE